MARVIKKYANRKLYDTRAKQYLTLDQIAGLVQAGEAVQVIDNETKQDITNVVLSSIILDGAKKEQSPLPDTMLVDLIQKRGEAVMRVVKESVAAGMSAAGMVQQELEKRIKEAIERGREQADSLVAMGESVEFLFKDFIERTQKTVEATVEKTVARLIATMNIPTKAEIQQLERQVAGLSKQVERLAKRHAGTKAKAKAVKTKRTRK
jgi:polyhydroxyalkanoate synthesis repressor PhaR